MWSVTSSSKLLVCCRDVVVWPFAHGSRSVSARKQLLAAVDVVGRAGDGRIRHEVNRERGDVGGTADRAGRERGAEFCAACVELIAEKRGRERRVDESGGDEVHADRCELEGQVSCQRGKRPRERCDEREPGGGAPAGGAAHKKERPSRTYLDRCVSRDLDRA